MGTYRLRAECLADVRELKARLAGDEIKINKYKYLPDVEVLIVSERSIAGLLMLMSLIPDSHVMQETLAVAENYTGDRDYAKMESMGWKLDE